MSLKSLKCEIISHDSFEMFVLLKGVNDFRGLFGNTFEMGLILFLDVQYKVQCS